MPWWPTLILTQLDTTSGSIFELRAKLASRTFAFKYWTWEKSTQVLKKEWKLQYLVSRNGESRKSDGIEVVLILSTPSIK